MRKYWIAGLVGLVAAAVAATTVFAADTQVNTYKVTGSTKGGKGATKSKPKPVSLSFDYQVGEEHGLRPSVVTKYSIFFGGGIANNSAFTGCKPALVSDSGPGPSACPKKSIVGSGAVHNSTGASDNPADKDNPAYLCNLKLTTINSTVKNHFLLYLQGIPGAADVSERCVLPVHQAIDAKFVKHAKGVSLDFAVPSILVHPLGPGKIDNAVIQVGSKIKKATAKKGGKKVGFFESTSCPKGKQTISVTFTQEAGGVKKTASQSVSCK